MRRNIASVLLFLVFFGCTPAVTSRGMTFVAGLKRYQDEMGRLEARPERWPERQRLAESLKTIYTFTIGGSEEFNRLVNMDLRKREFLIALREGSVRPERVKEMNEELVKISKQVDGLGEVIKGQVLHTELHGYDQPQHIESVATIGLVNLAMESFSSANRGVSVRSTKVGLYVVTDQGDVSTVRTAEGQTFRCSTTTIQDEGATIKCEPAGGKP
ncbi:MAG: hypothetical protein ACREQA_22250 [Candidatus Binatia bacterium]